MSLPTVSVTLTAIDSSGLPVAGARVQAVLDRLEIYQGFVVPNQVNATTDESGVVVLDLFPNALGSNGSAYQVRAWHPETGRRFLDARAVVPNSNCNLDQIIVQEPFPALDAAQQALIAAQGALAPVTAQAQAASASALVAQDAEDGALAAEAAAQGHATEAEASKTAAAQSESNAAASETSAQASAQSASTSAASASASATQAQTAASTATTQATAASQSASSAQASASAAATSQSAAAGSASSAQASATSAAASANTSSSAAIAAQLSQTAAAESAIAAKASEDAAEDIATQVAGQVGIATSAANSAAAQAITAAGHASTATTKAAEAADSADLAKDWATMIGSEVMVGHGYSAKQYAQNAAASASQTEADRVQTGLDAAASASSEAVATTQASIATTKADEATSSAALANTKAGEAAGSAAQALAIYGDTTAVQTAVAQAAAQASLAAGYAASASSVVQQDLSGVNAAALHRSPNAVTAMFVYDTSKDSDGGAWTEKCQHTSWYNEAINGKWLGAHSSEANARNEGAVLGPELLTNGDFSNGTAGWTAGTGWTIGSGVATKTPGVQSFLDTLSPSSFVTGATYKISITCTRSAGNLYVYIRGALSLQFSAGANPSGGTITVYVQAGSSSVTGLRIEGDAFFAGTVDNISVREVTAQTTQTGDYFQLTTDGKFYRLNAGSGTTEVFRGNKRDFPRLAGIVAEAGNVNIYDLTEPGRPMWMRFTTPGSTNGAIRNPGGGIISTVYALNGKLFSGNTGTTSGYGPSAVDFPSERVESYEWVNYRTFRGNIAERNAEKGYLQVRAHGGGGFVNATALAMTVLPDAPVDPVTGLKVPTIAVATASGIFVIQHSGVVRNSSSTLSFATVTLTPTLLSAGRADTTWYWAQNPGALGASFALSTDTNTAAPDFNIGNTNGLLAPTRSELLRRSATAATVQKLKNHESTPARGIAATITNTFNTGHLVGDIRRCYLSDNTVGSVTGPELVTNGTFDTADGWSVGTGWSITSGVATKSGGATQNINRTDSAFVAGRVYEFSLDVVAFTSGTLRVELPGVIWAQFSPVGTGHFRAVLRPTVNGGFFYIYDGVTPFVGSIDNVSVKELVADRSYKAQGASITGTLTKSAVASAAELVAYSGFSNSNYLREPYSADLDFGTGEWTCSAWVNVPPRYNLLTRTEQFDNAVWVKNAASVISNEVVSPDGNVNADFAYADTSTNEHYIEYSLPLGAATYAFSIYVKAKGVSSVALRPIHVGETLATSTTPFSIVNGEFIAPNPASRVTATSATNVGNGWYRLSVTYSITNSTTTHRIRIYPNGAGTSPGDGTSGIYIWGASLTPANQASLPYQRVNTATDYDGSTATIVERRHSTGSYIQLGVVEGGNLTATAFDGTTTRTVTTTAAYNTATWLKARVNYRAGRLSIMVNGVEVAVTNGAPLLTLNNSNAVLTIGNSFNLDAPFPGSIALLKFSATVPTAEQSVWMYEQEKQMFREGAQVCLPDSGSIVDLAYDEATDKWIAVSAANESEWSGLVRTSVTPVPAGSYSRVSAGGGVQLLARTTTSPGVDVTIPAYGLREELVKRAEAAARINQDVVVFDFDTIGFTAAMTNGSNQVTASSITGTPFVGMAITGTGITAGTTITGINGTTYTLSANATATGSNAVGQAGFDLPVGYTARVVYSAGAQRREGSTRDYTRLFDGFREQIRFAVTPGSGTWVQIHAVKEAA